MRKIIVAGNWKMNKDLHETKLFIEKLSHFSQGKDFGHCEIVIAPPFLFLDRANGMCEQTPIRLSAQNVNDNEQGAYTGEISAAMLKSVGISYCIIGHSERRAYYGETNEIINKKAQILRNHRIMPIICVGETLAQREADQTQAVVLEQLEKCFRDLDLEVDPNTVIAYEPVWAIGTGKTATPEQAQEVHALIRSFLKEHYSDVVAERISLLYGGSVKPDNFKELLEQNDIDGGLIGGASLDADSFISMIQTAHEYTER
ncbi:MAG TPA: triose-phosphate isomerase [Candidatus Cloacimonadota bacterium]|nr:triose-phosphate isomerase [Candidatus Cloacimonadota bacterium]HPT71252.1 triose-phosphate isomerase [Candidatus Cloacimonadota bacterium]